MVFFLSQMGTQINLIGLGLVVLGMLCLIWGLYRKEVSPLGLALLISGFLLQLAAAFIA
jgi:hypothetical protein